MVKKRFMLFEEFCVPSLAGQTNQNFDWLCFFDENTPNNYKEKINKLFTPHKNFHAIFTSEYGNVTADPFRVEIYKRLNSETTHLITTRLDNDDALAKDFISQISSNANRNEHDYFLNCLKGIQYDTRNKVMSLCRQQSNAFISRVEKIENEKIKTVMAIMHPLASQHAAVHNIYKNRLFMQVIHDSNIVNIFGIKTIPVFSNKRVKKLFNVHSDLKIDNKAILKNYIYAFFSIIKSKLK